MNNLFFCSIIRKKYYKLVEPYYYFTLVDSDGNVLEICGDIYE